MGRQEQHLQIHGAMRSPVVLGDGANFIGRSREYVKWGGQEMQLLGEGLGILTLDTQQKQAFTPIPTTPLTIGLEAWLPDLHHH